jgi:hypothetical protein
MTAEDNSQHPVWEVYDAYRTARLNFKYLCAKLSFNRRCNFVIEFALALTTSSSAAALWIWNTPLGQTVWKTLIVVSAFLAVLKPLLKLTDRVAHLEEAVAKWRSLEYDLYRIVRGIRRSKAFTQKLERAFDATLDKAHDLDIKTMEPSVNEKLRRKCADAVNREMPAAKFYVPPQEVQ